jgi:hypothetical protein
MLRFGDDWLANPGRPSLDLMHAASGDVCPPLNVCSACGKTGTAVRLAFRDGPGTGPFAGFDLPQWRCLADDDQYERRRLSSARPPLTLTVALRIPADPLERLSARQILRRHRYQKRAGRLGNVLTETSQAFSLPMIEIDVEAIAGWNLGQLEFVWSSWPRWRQE